MSKTPTQQLRIIGGEWRSRRLRFPAIDGLRPTMDRVRETLFNWLQFDIAGARVLDAFAGSGALGLEALSRGAKEVVFLEKNPKAALQLKDNLKTLQAPNAQVWAGDALQPALQQLTLLPGALVYVEHEQGLQPDIPAHWQLRKRKDTKEFCFALYQVESEA